MSFPFFISKKYTLSKRDSKFVTFISSISIIGIALGVATLIIALSILNGFEKTITQKITDFDSQIKITSFRTTLPNYHRIFPQLKKDLNGLAKEINPFASELAIIGSKHVKEGVSIKGVLPNNPLHGVAENIIAGSKFLSDSSLSSIILGKKLANKLMVGIGDKVTVFALKKDQIPSTENLPSIKQFKITGIFESGMAEYDDLYAYVNLNAAQDLFDIGDNITGYDIRVNNISKIDSLTKHLAEVLRYPHSVRSIYQIHRNIFTWVELQKKPIPIILGLIIIVAVFNIIGTLLMIVLEKTSAIGILKSLGASKKQIVSIFLYQGIFLAIVGIVSGNILAYLLMFFQQQYNIISLPSSVYFMSTVPIYFSTSIFLGVSALTLFLCIIASVIPSFVASKIKPVSTLRFN